MTVKLQKEKFCEILRLLFLFSLFINYVLSAFYKILGISTNSLQVVLNVFYIICFLLYICLKPGGKLMPFILSIFLAIMAIIPFLMINGLYDKAHSDLYTFLFLSLPCIVLFSDGINNNTTKILGKLCLITGTFFSLLFIVQAFIVEILNNFDYQSVSYALIIPIIYYIQKKKKIYELLLLIVMLFFAIFMGGRGPLICILLYFAYHFLSTKKVKLIFKILLIVGIILAIVFYEPIILFIAKKSSDLGLSGSFSTYLKYGDILSDSGRNDIYKYCFDIAKDNWLVGNGFFSDRLLLLPINKSYPHNLFIEMIIQLGYPITIIIMSFMVFNFLKFLFNKNIGPEKKIIFDILFFSTGFMILMFSSSYLIWPSFFAMVSMFLSKRSECS